MANHAQAGSGRPRHRWRRAGWAAVVLVLLLPFLALYLQAAS
jgi:hypothetical protein